MLSFHQHPDGLIYIRDGHTVIYSGTLAEFVEESGIALPPLPANTTERIYEQGRRHALMNESGLVGGGPMPWPLGDQIIENRTALEIKKHRREVAQAEALQTKATDESASPPSPRRKR